jgi:hypothetical protein
MNFMKAAARITKRFARRAINAVGYDISTLNPQFELIRKRTDVLNVEVLEDPLFQASIDETYHLTLLDTARLANLWQLCRLSNPEGAIIEVGSYKGGSAIHLSNSCPTRRVIVCDTFEGFGNLPVDANLDKIFSREHFIDANFETVKAAFDKKNRNVTLLKGYFPASASAANENIQGVSFAHIDADIYRSTIDTLEFLLPRFIARSIILFDDYLRRADGVIKAVEEFQMAHREWKSFPIYPGQGLMIHESWFGR